MEQQEIIAQVKQSIGECEKLLIGIGEEWSSDKVPDVSGVYDGLAELIRQKDYFIVTANVDGEIFKSRLDGRQVTAPCGNETWRQCSKSCTRDIWEPGELPEDMCPHCGESLTGNTIHAKEYIEEGYLPQWKVYTDWLTHTLNRQLLILELGVGFQTPTVIRWPFEKTAFFNKKAKMYRIHRHFSQISEELKERVVPVAENSVEFIRQLW